MVSVLPFLSFFFRRSISVIHTRYVRKKFIFQKKKNKLIFLFTSNWIEWSWFSLSCKFSNMFFGHFCNKTSFILESRSVGMCFYWLKLCEEFQQILDDWIFLSNINIHSTTWTLFLCKHDADCWVGNTKRNNEDLKGRLNATFIYRQSDVWVQWAGRVIREASRVNDMLTQRIRTSKEKLVLHINLMFWESSGFNISLNGSLKQQKPTLLPFQGWKIS